MKKDEREILTRQNILKKLIYAAKRLERMRFIIPNLVCWKYIRKKSQSVHLNMRRFQAEL